MLLELVLKNKMSDWRNQAWSGVFPATLCPFHDDESIDEEGLKQYIDEVSSVEGINGVVCNGHTGEIMSLRPYERDRVTSVVRSAVDAVNARDNRDVRTVTGVSLMGSSTLLNE